MTNFPRRARIGAGIALFTTAALGLTACATGAETVSYTHLTLPTNREV